MDIYQQVGQRMRAIRKAKGLTQGDVAAHVDVTTNTYSRWERGERAPSFQDLALIAAFLGVPLIRFFADPLDDDLLQTIAALPKQMQQEILAFARFRLMN